MSESKNERGRPNLGKVRMTFTLSPQIAKKLKKQAGTKYGEQTAIVERALAREFGIEPWPPEPGAD